MFIGGSLVCIIANLHWIEEYSSFFVFALAACFGLIGFIDDYYKIHNRRDMGLTAFQKAMLQAAVSAVFLYVLYMSGILTCDLYIPFLNKRYFIPPIVYGIFGMFVIVGCVNSVNLTDGIDGLSSSVTIPVMVFFTAASLAMKRYDLALMPAAMIGGLLAYLSLNWHPAKLFMGDTGSLALGAAFACTSIMTNTEVVSLIIGGLFIVETLSVMIQVVYFHFTHKRVFLMAPIHHHFEKKGWAETKVVIRFWIIAAAFGAVGLALFFQLG